ncbi:MAG: hypothetical protein ACYC0V_21525 [Armatimonadota bacterium]
MATQAQKDYARTKVSNERRAGRLEKPDKCEACGRSAVGRRINAHHVDYYGAPTNVIWLCDQCHAQMHELIDSDMDCKDAFAHYQALLDNGLHI